ncbi:MAG: restriction endonuclease subunit S, partial [Candidatus Sumerlaeia bacterium]|nr:restriction endonuclease subunit S [Candidatus Sumerlaeia bacterium]
MTLADLMQEFSVVTDTAAGLSELRSLILGLAVRGKLVPQDPNDEPASELLKKIEAEKQRLYERGEIKIPKKNLPISDEQKLFDLPSNWIWVRNGSLIIFQNGYAFSSALFQATGIGVIRIGDLQNGYVVENTMKYISEKEASEVKDDFIVNEGDMLIAMSGATTGKLAINKSNKKYLLNQRVGKIIPIHINKDYLYRYLNTKIEENLKISSGSAIPNLSTKQIDELPIPLPPLAEQHRIVEKIEALFAEVDALEEKLNRQAKLDEQLQLAVNADVQQAPDAAASQTAWHFITRHFGTLYSSPEAIDNLKKNILNEAVRGRLVPQDPNDEPASELLKKIEAEKQRLYEAGEIRKPKELPPIEEDEIPFEVPESWEWCRFGENALDYSTGLERGRKEQDLNKSYPYLKMNNISNDGSLILSDIVRVDANEEEVKQNAQY